jgi:hypothetical protein
LSHAGALRLELSPSGAYAAVVLAVHSAAAACFLTAMTGWPGPILAVLTAALGAAAARDRALLRGARSPRAIEIPAIGEARVLLASGESFPVRPVGGMGVTPLWVALARNSTAGRSLLVTAGMLGPRGARLLRLWALWGRVPGATPR